MEGTSIVRKESVGRWMRRARLMGVLLVFAGRRARRGVRSVRSVFEPLSDDDDAAGFVRSSPIIAVQVAPTAAIDHPWRRMTANEPIDRLLQLCLHKTHRTLLFIGDIKGASDRMTRPKSVHNHLTNTNHRSITTTLTVTSCTNK